VTFDLLRNFPLLASNQNLAIQTQFNLPLTAQILPQTSKPTGKPGLVLTFTAVQTQNCLQKDKEFAKQL